jgi:hypothetical protein
MHLGRTGTLKQLSSRIQRSASSRNICDSFGFYFRVYAKKYNYISRHVRLKTILASVRPAGASAVPHRFLATVRAWQRVHGLS